jgi:hypothetical protein
MDNTHLRHIAMRNLWPALTPGNGPVEAHLQ